MTPEVRWRPDPARAASSRMAVLHARCEVAAGRSLDGYAALHRYSVDAPADFWRCLFEHLDLLHDGSRDPSLEGDAVATARFFPRVSLSHPENVLRPLDDATEAAPAIVSRSEDGARRSLTRAALRERVLRAAGALANLGVAAGDRVAAVARNDLEAAVAMFAVTALGATWSAVSPDLPTAAVLARFAPLAPTLLLAHTAWTQQGRTMSLDAQLAAACDGLPSLRASASLDGGAIASGTFRGSLPALAEAAAAAAWRRFPFDHPLLVLFSSGTTGAPKCIVHGHGGTLVEHAKELAVHADLRPDDALLFHTTAAWMMHPWALSALFTGARVVLYDGAAAHPEPDALVRVVAEEGVTVFGTSPAYVQYLRALDRSPARAHDLSRLRAVLSTGSVLTASQHDDLREMFGDVQVQSISGGTDIIGCFVLGAPTVPVHRGESPCVGLGLDVRAHDGVEARRVGVGELVCAGPFPSRPVGLWGDVDGRGFHEAYFAAHEGLWTHGDVVELTARGTAVIHGRSDGVMNLRGVRVGPAEVYRALDDVREIAAMLATDQPWPDEPGGRRLVLLVELAAGLALDRPLTLRIKRLLKERASPVHVPAVVAQVAALPRTHTGKVSERAAQDALAGRAVRNRDALRDPSALDAVLRAVADVRA